MEIITIGKLEKVQAEDVKNVAKTRILTMRRK
jgi:hypothetical protein